MFNSRMWLISESVQTTEHGTQATVCTYLEYTQGTFKAVFHDIPGPILWFSVLINRVDIEHVKFSYTFNN